MIIDKTNFDIHNLKLVIWDLDNTFWEGILSEGGIQRFIPANIEIVKVLSRRGIMNSICSKNTFSQCEEILSGIGLWDYFVFPSIDWTTKGTRIKEIISSMQLRPTNVLFLDDEPFNLQLAMEENEGLMCATAEDLVPVLAEQCRCLPVDDSMKRLRQYQELQVKAKAKEEFSSNDMFLRQSEIKVSVSSDCLGHLDRICELVSRTNQLNFTKRRDSREELLQIINNPDYQCGLISCRDKYSDYGEIGFYTLDRIKHELIHFLFSCRTIGMGVEQWMYAKLGFPTLHATGALVTELNQRECPDWIEAEDQPKGRIELQTDEKKATILLKGPCDISQVLPYLSNQKDIDEEFAYVSAAKGGVYIEAYNHTLSILQTVRLSKEKKAFLTEKLPFIDENYFATSLFSKQYDYVILSLLTDYGLGLYQDMEDPSIRVPFGQHTIDYTDEKNWLERIGPIRGDLRAQYDFFRTHYKPVGQISAEELTRNIRAIRKLLPEHTQLILLNGSELAYPGECKYWLVGREKEHKEMNAAVREAVASMDRCNIIDINSLLTSPDLYLDTINHYKKSVYYAIAQEIQRYSEQTGSGSIMIKSRTRLEMEKRLSQIKRFLHYFIRS